MYKIQSLGGSNTCALCIGQVVAKGSNLHHNGHI